jgi:hypothetical protein
MDDQLGQVALCELRFKSVMDLEVAVCRYLADHSEQAKPFPRTAKSTDSLDKVLRGKTIGSQHTRLG